MGLAISFVSTVPEKVWYHTCPSKGKNCHNTKLVEQHGCCKWYTEMTYLADIEEHLGKIKKKESEPSNYGLPRIRVRVFCPALKTLFILVYIFILNRCNYLSNR